MYVDPILLIYPSPLPLPFGNHVIIIFKWVNESQCNSSILLYSMENRRKLSQANKRNLWGTHSQIRRWHPTPVLLLGKSHGWRSPVGWSPWGHWGSYTTERLHFHFSLSCIGEGNGNPLQCSCLENPRDRAAWWAAVYGVAQSRTWLKRLSSSSSRRTY